MKKKINVTYPLLGGSCRRNKLRQRVVMVYFSRK